MKFYVIIILLVGISLGNVDILIPYPETVPVVGWTDNDMPWMMYCEEPKQPVCLGNSSSDLFLSYHRVSGQNPVLLVISGVFDSWHESVDLRTVTLWDFSQDYYRELTAQEFTPPPGQCCWFKLPILPRYTFTEDDRTAFIVMNTGYTDVLVQDQTWMTTIPVDPWSPLLVDPSNTTSWNQCPYIHSVSLSGQIPEGTLPMFSPGSGFSYCEMLPSDYGVCSFVENDMLECNEFYGISYFNPDIVPSVLCSGYGQTDQLALWNDTGGAVWCANFITSPAEPANVPLSVSHSELPFASAMTKTREDEGMALVWYDGSNIMIRHWDGEWSSYSHVVESWSHISPGNIAVCSDANGYWVAWKDDVELLAEYRFIPRTTITGIEESGVEFDSGMELSLDNNPVQNSTVYSAAQPFAGYYSLQLYDLSGRSIEEIASGYDKKIEGVLDLSGYPSGVYTLVLETGTGADSVRLLKTGN